jgi:hypothetical protein
LRALHGNIGRRAAVIPPHVAPLAGELQAPRSSSESMTARSCSQRRASS